MEVRLNFDFLSEVRSSEIVVNDTKFSIFFGVLAVKIKLRKLERRSP